VRPDQTGVATGINTIMRSIGGSVGAQIAAAIIAGNQIFGGRYPAESGFTDAFVMSAVAAVVALAVTALIPRPARRGVVSVPVGSEA
jgi:sugar phosphate permease